MTNRRPPAPAAPAVRATAEVSVVGTPPGQAARPPAPAAEVGQGRAARRARIPVARAAAERVAEGGVPLVEAVAARVPVAAARVPAAAPVPAAAQGGAVQAQEAADRRVKTRQRRTTPRPSTAAAIAPKHLRRARLTSTRA